MHCFPSLICIGAMKAGTFELKSWLDEHPMVQSATKEVGMRIHLETSARNVLPPTGLPAGPSADPPSALPLRC